MPAKTRIAPYINWQKPDFTKIVKTNKDFRSNYEAAMLYIHNSMTTDDLKKEVLKYLKNTKSQLLEQAKNIHENRFATIGKYIYLVNHRAELPENIESGLAKKLNTLITEEYEKVQAAAKEKQAREKPAAVNVISIQERLLERSRSVAGEIEGWLDDFILDKKQPAKTVEEFVNLYKANELKAPHMRHMEQIFARRTAEVKDLVENQNKELAEGYGNFSKAELKKLLAFFTNLNQACGMLQDAARATRAPKTKKPVSEEKQIAKLKYKKEDSTLGIASVNPVQIIGAKELWVYNTKTRKLAQYKATDERGLAVKGTAILNFTTDSVEKTLRKPADTLADFKKASKVKLRTFLKDIATVDVPANGKLNENHIILRVDK